MQATRVADDALYAPIATYRNNGTEITAAGVVHVAAPHYYSNVQRALEETTEGLFEGVTLSPVKLSLRHKGRRRTMRRFFEAYKDLARYLGVMHQEVGLPLDPSWSNPDMSDRELAAALPQSFWNGMEDLIRDVDLLRRVHYEQPQALARFMKGIGIRSYGGKRPSPLLTPETERVIMERRNRLLFDALEERLEEEKPGRIGIVYGGEHIVGLDKFLRQRGFTHTKTLWLPAWRVTEPLTMEEAEARLGAHAETARRVAFPLLNER